MMVNNKKISGEDLPDFVREAEATMEAEEKKIPNAEAEVTIKFGRGLVGTPFLSKNGKELVEVQIPNVDPTDQRPWESFVISPRMIHENKYSNGLWMKLPAAGTTKLCRTVRNGVDADGKPIWKKEYRTVVNEELKALLESYKNRKSVIDRLSEKKENVKENDAAAPKRTKKSAQVKHEESL